MQGIVVDERKIVKSEKEKSQNRMANYAANSYKVFLCLSAARRNRASRSARMSLLRVLPSLSLSFSDSALF